MTSVPKQASDPPKEVKRARLQIALLTILGIAIALTAEWPLSSGTDLKWRATQALKWAAVFACHHFALRAAWRAGREERP